MTVPHVWINHRRIKDIFKWSGKCLAGVQAAIPHHYKQLFAEPWLSQPPKKATTCLQPLLPQFRPTGQLPSFRPSSKHMPEHCYPVQHPGTHWRSPLSAALPRSRPSRGKNLPPCEAIRLCGTLAQGKRILTWWQATPWAKNAKDHSNKIWARYIV